MIRALEPESLDVAGISGGWGGQFCFRSYERFLYPEYEYLRGARSRAPMDNSRWSARGLANPLIACGFDEGEVRAEQWGNRYAAARNLEVSWPPIYDKAIARRT